MKRANSRLIIATLAILLSSQNANSQVNSSDKSPRDEKKEVVKNNIFYSGMKEGVACYRIPAIVTAKNGDLIAAIDERVPSCGDLKWSKDINIVIRRSSDNGKSWTQQETIIDFPYGQSASDPSMIVDKKTGDIFMFYNYMDLENEKDVYYLHYVKSKDNGKTWSNPTDITSQISKPEWKKDMKFITSGRGIYTSTGKLLHTMVNLNSGLRVFGSDDHGKSWYFIDNHIHPADESKIVELSDGRWMINSRVNGAGKRYVHISSDEGRNWESLPENQLIDPSCNASIISYTSTRDGYDKNRLLFCNATDAKERRNLTIRVSYDDGKSWSEGKVITSKSAAYSSMTKLKNGDIAIFYETDGYKSNVVEIVTLEWITDGKDRYTKPKRVRKRK